MDPVRVAVVDSGIHAGHPHVQGVAAGAGFEVDGREHGDWVDRLGHGTAVAAAIRDFAPSVTLLAAKVFETSLATSVDALVAAIRWSAAHDADLINLSLGVADPEHTGRMERAVLDASSRGSLIVAAGQRDGVRWLPGTLDGVLTVELDWSYPRGRYEVVGQGASMVFRTSGYPRPIPGIDPERNLKGLSFAVANMTGLAANAMSKHPVRGYRDVVNLLTGSATT